MAGEITLPEITIQGDPASPSITMADWWADGFVAGYNAPDSQIERPLMINDDVAAVFFNGVSEGQQAAHDRIAEIEAQFADQPQITGDLHGESFAKAEERFNELLEDVVHEHMPHTEIEHMEEGKEPTEIPDLPVLRPVE